MVGHPGGPGFDGATLADLGGLARSHHLILLDPMGTGRSDAPSDGRYDLEAYADDLVSVLEQVAGEHGRPARALVGHSHGGLVAVAALSERPDLVERLVLVDMPTHAEGLVEQVDRLALQTFGDGRERSWGLDEDFEEALAETSLSVAPVEWFNRHSVDSFDVRPHLAALRLPTLVVVGRHDETTTVADARDLVNALPDARLAVIEGSGHVPFLERPDAFRAAVEAFLAGDDG